MCINSVLNNVEVAALVLGAPRLTTLRRLLLPVEELAFVALVERGFV